MSLLWKYVIVIVLQILLLNFASYVIAVATHQEEVLGLKDLAGLLFLLHHWSHTPFVGPYIKKGLNATHLKDQDLLFEFYFLFAFYQY